MRTPTFEAKLRAAGPLGTALAVAGAARREPATVAVHLVTGLPGRVRTRANLAAGDGDDGSRPVRHYGERETVAVAPPPGSPPGLARAAGTYALERPFVRTVADARLLTETGLVADADGALLLETTLGRRDLLDRALLSEPGVLARAALSPGSLATDPADRTVSGPVCSLVDAALGGFSHWLLAAVPRLAGLDRWERATGERATLLVPPDPPPWVPATLVLLGYGDRYREVDATPLRLARLVVPSVRSPEQRRSAFVKAFTFDPAYKLVAPSACRWVRERVRAPVDADTSGPRRLYLSRADAGRRRVANREALRSALQPRGFETYVAAEDDLAAQIARLAAAEVVVAPHGAGLAHQLWSRDLAVVELFGPAAKPTYCMLAAALGHDYAAVAGTAPDRAGGDDAASGGPDAGTQVGGDADAGTDGRRGIDSDVVVDPDAVLDALDRLGVD